MATPQRPGARRPAAGGPPSQSGGNRRSGAQSVEELRALPEFVDEGENINLDPGMASDGGLGAGEGTTVTIVKAHFGRFEYPGRDDLAPQLRLFLDLQREGYDEPRTESLNYANLGMFASTKDGNFIRPRPQIMKDRTTAPTPYKYNAGVLFLQSLKDAGLSVDKLNKEGVSALNGLVVHVRKRKVSGQNEEAKPALMVDYIEGGDPTATAGKTAAPRVSSPRKETAAAPPSAPATRTASASAEGIATNVDALAEEALLDLLTAADGNTLSRSQIPTTLIQSAKWSKHESRGGILKLLRTDEFITREGSPWVLDGSTISLA